jgi:glycerol-3-phosphate acyltransferase PlsY
MNPSFLTALAVAFFVGSIPTAYLIGKWVRGTDIREHGSGNVGATNAFRVFGKRVGLLVFAIDFGKGLLSTTLVPMALYPEASLEAVLWVGLGAILGHIFTPFLGFKGGKGIATGGGIVCGAVPVIFAIVISTWGISFLLTRVVSVSSLLAILALVVCSIFFDLSWHARLFFLLLLMMGLWTHRDNLKRLKRGGEKFRKS